MHKILLESAIFHAKHGVFEEENIIGGKFEVNLELITDFSESMKTDNLDGTVDYSALFTIIKNEMKVPSKLLEHLGSRIILKLQKTYPQIQKVTLKISKLTPPIQGELDKVSIVIEESFTNT